MSGSAPRGRQVCTPAEACGPVVAMGSGAAREQREAALKVGCRTQGISPPRWCGCLVLQERIHMCKVPFFRNYIQISGESCVFRYFSASFQNSSMLTIEKKGSIGRKKWTD